MNMRIVVVHNRYRSANPSGENRVVDGDIEQLRAAGVDVVPYFRNSDEIAEWSRARKVSLAWRPVMSPSDSIALRRLLREVKPDVVHLHNPFPLISPWIIRTAKAQSLPVVQTVHNYRHVCVNGVHFRDGAACTECVGTRSSWPAIQHRCYQNSRAATVPMVIAQVAHRPTWRLVDLFLPVGNGVADQLRSLGVSEDRIRVRPNVVADPGEPSRLGTGVLFVGRLSEEKGVRLLLDSWRRSGLGTETTLTIAGDGPLAALVHSSADRDTSIKPVGYLDSEALTAAYDSSALVVVPSLCYEAHPLALVAAMAHGRPTVAIESAVTREHVGNDAGWLCDPTDEGLATTLSEALHDRVGLDRRASAARRKYLKDNGSRTDTSLMHVYQELLGASHAEAMAAEETS